ncbi:potassium/sodium hyperpolarization-activated cyclic nucleotide-gated channel 1-like [Frieseomelitta varia]|uniref:potassium/sodium hyperpolarization-activated cyclic nucleotide-gated channel 1-like n=1 Tax=Frieseomelitta varia TaxID=561572 RepID=UPI001CB67FE7|nr:potassium/sodium hyperpolarization-activated cyclic nucleotide-gated channel 1-like [Frieseomelitta varia]
MEEHICGLQNGERKKTFTHIFQIGGNTPRTKMHFDSMAQVSAERERHAAYWCIIHPFSNWRFFWDLIMTVIYLIAFLTIPFSVCFIIMSHDEVLMDKFNISIYTFCWLDIVFNCFTGYYDKNSMQVELNPSKIFLRKIFSPHRNYLKTFLILDVVSSLPWDHITLPWRTVPGRESNHLVALLNLLPCLKLSRYGYVNKQISELFIVTILLYFEIMHFYYEMFATLMMGFYIMYWSSCLCYLIPVLVLHFSNSSHDECPECWMTGLDSDSIAFRFQYALFIVVEKLSASGYGGYVPDTDGHIVLSCALMLIGRVLECYIAGMDIFITFLESQSQTSMITRLIKFQVMLIQIKAGRMASKLKFQEIINQLGAYTCQKQLPAHMKIRLLAYYYCRFRNSYFREKNILSQLSERLRQEIAFQSSHRLIENVAIFKELPKSVLRLIVKHLKFELYLPNDVIVKAGAVGDCMFFLSAGTVAVLTPTGKEICHLNDGAHFGEIALLVPDQRRVASVIAIEVCEVYRLDRKNFRKCIAVHTELFAKIEKIASERIEKAMVVEEQHKRHASVMQKTVL